MSEPRPKKKRKPGGSFCAVGGCSHRSSGDTASAHRERDFLRYLPLPKEPVAKDAWLKRMKRNLIFWNPSSRVCTDHFFESDFREDDLARYRNNVNSDKRTQIRLRPNSAPNTDRTTGRFADPFEQINRRPPPIDRCSEIADESANLENMEVASPITYVNFISLYYYSMLRNPNSIQLM